MNISIQKELPEHNHAVHKILTTCFRTDAESKLVAMLRINDKVILSLVAVYNREVVGHVMFSPVTTSPSSIIKGLGLAPLAVKPEYQKQGVGAQLVREGLSMCAELEYDYVVLLGDPNYYQRFGFSKASDFGIQNEYGVDNPFMVIKLTDCNLEKGLIKYCPEFSLFSV
ncbi:MAG: N-acetyltransferase [Chloroflexi bacterium]|nr:N-acetyltransferase [Chloroflexota bacterium]